MQRRAEMQRQEAEQRAEMDRHIQSLRDEEKKKYYSKPRQRSRRWWQFWKRNKRTTEGWD